MGMPSRRLLYLRNTSMGRISVDGITVRDGSLASAGNGLHAIAAQARAVTIISSSRFIRNSASQANGGGAGAYIGCDIAEADVLENEFIENRSAGDGGGVSFGCAAVDTRLLRNQLLATGKLGHRQRRWSLYRPCQRCGRGYFAE